MTEDELERHLARLRHQGTDDGRVEVKAAAGGLSKTVWQTVSAFANTDGGVVILGLDERNGFAPAQGFEAAPLMDALRQGLIRVLGEKPKVQPVPEYEIDRASVNGGDVVILTVRPLRPAPGIALPCYVMKWSPESFLNTTKTASASMIWA